VRIVHRGIDRVGDALAPEGVEVLAASIGQAGAHLQPIRLHQVERAQQSVETGEDAQVTLRKLQAHRDQRPRVEPVVDIAIESQDRLFGVAGVNGRAHSA
jgi:hypothetical protein